MKRLLFCLSLLALIDFPARGSEDSIDLLKSMFEPDSKTNLTFASYEICPAKFTNVISNTNLFSKDEQTNLTRILGTHHVAISTNSGPQGTQLISIEKTNGCLVAHFKYVNSDAIEDIYFGDRGALAKFGGGYEGFSALSNPLMRFRTKNNDGYDLTITRPDLDGISTITFAQIANGKLNGLFVTLNNEHCEQLLRFVDGKAVGQWFLWDTRRNNSLVKIKIKLPLDYFKYMTQKVNL